MLSIVRRDWSESSLQNWQLSDFHLSPAADAPDGGDSLVLALQAILQAGGARADYDELCAVLGLSFMICAPQDVATAFDLWSTYGRDACLVNVADAYGLRPARSPPPRRAARQLDSSPEFGQHFDASYRPLVAREHWRTASRSWPGTAGRIRRGTPGGSSPQPPSPA